MDSAVEKLQGALDSESESDLFDGSTVAYMGPVYALNYLLISKKVKLQIKFLISV